MKKIIELSDKVKLKLEIKAAKKGKKLKPYIEDLLIEHANNKKRGE